MALDLFTQNHVLSEIAAPFVDRLAPLLAELPADLPARVAIINALRLELHSVSPFSAEPVDCVQWVSADELTANDYNPNAVAPPEMRLLEHSIGADGYTQPIVAWRRVMGYLPVTVINDSRQDRGDRIAATIRHNRARGKHRVESMSDIVVELKRRNWSDDKIGRELGMDPDEVLRLCQITGLIEVFADQDFSRAWDIESAEATTGAEVLSDIDGPVTTDSKRVLHTWDKWECYPAGFYEERPPDGVTQDEGEEKYRESAAYERYLQLRRERVAEKINARP